MEHRDTQLSQAYRDAAHPEPSPALDARILDAARQAVAKPAAHKRRTWFAWAVPFSTAAVLVLGITLLFQIQRDAPEVMDSSTAIPPLSLEPPAPVETALPPPTAATESSRPPGVSKQRARPLASETPSAPESAAQERSEAADAAPAPQPFPAQTLPPPSAAKAEARQPRAAPDTLRDATEAMSNQAARPPVQSSKLPAPAAMAPAREGATALDRTLEKRMADPVVESPEAMLEAIRRLLRAGRLDEARKALEKLRQDYPDYEIPDDLKRMQAP